MKHFALDHHTRTITITRPLPTLVNRARRLLPAKPPADAMDLWVLITMIYSPTGDKVRRFEAEPLFPGPVEETEVEGMTLPSITKISGKINHHTSPKEPAVIYQTVETKPSWQRNNIATEMLHRLHDRLGIYGTPALEAADSPAGKALAHRMAETGWTTIR